MIGIEPGDSKKWNDAPTVLLCAIPVLSVFSPERIYNGDYTQTRNSTTQKMLRMVGFGDNIGSGFQKIMKAWQSLG